MKQNGRRFVLVLLAAGKSVRYCQENPSIPKTFLRMQGKPLYLHALIPFLEQKELYNIILVSPTNQHQDIRHALKHHAITHPIILISGGKERFFSVHNALKHLQNKTAYVLIHDAARPTVHKTDIHHLLTQLFKGKHKGVVPGEPLTNTIKQVNSQGWITHHLHRSELREITTPQAFPIKTLKAAYDACYHHHVQTHQGLPTDDAEVFAKYLLQENSPLNERIHVLRFQHPNPKLTFAWELPMIQHLLEKRSQNP